MGRAGDEIFNQLAKWQSMSAGVLRMPVVLRISVGSKYGAQHSQDWTSITAHIPGLKVMFPATPYDAKGMLNLALRGTDPVVFFESQRIYDVGEIFQPGGVPEGYYEVEEGEPALRREGKDLTIVSIGATLYRAMEAAEELEKKHGVSAEVIDARFLVPLNYEKILESVKKTGKVLLTSDASERGSFLQHHGRPDHPGRLRRPGRAAGGGGQPQLDHPGGGDGVGLLPAEGVDRRRGARAPPAAAPATRRPPTSRSRSSCGAAAGGCERPSAGGGRGRPARLLTPGA